MRQLPFTFFPFFPSEVFHVRVSFPARGSCQPVDRRGRGRGRRCQSRRRRAKVIDRLTASFGPVVTEIINLIEAGATSLPAILQALQSAGVALPSWATTVVAILLAIVKPAA